MLGVHKSRVVLLQAGQIAALACILFFHSRELLSIWVEHATATIQSLLTVRTLAIARQLLLPFNLALLYVMLLLVYIQFAVGQDGTFVRWRELMDTSSILIFTALHGIIRKRNCSTMLGQKAGLVLLVTRVYDANEGAVWLARHGEKSALVLMARVIGGTSCVNQLLQKRDFNRADLFV